MRNNKQSLLTQIRITINILGYTDDNLIELFGKDYKQISRLNYEEVKTISSTLYKIYKGGV